LDGIRVADFTLHAAGPFCTQTLTMLGAECIKIETAGRPDIFRKPHPVYGRMEAATFDQVSAGKLSIRLNLKTARGIELARKLVGISDVVAESFRPGVMQRLGLDYETLSAINPRLIMVSISAAGQTGPESRHAGYAPLFSAAGGLGALTGYEDGPPVEIRHVMDHSTGLAASNAVLAACIARKRCGRGQHVDVAAREVAMSFIGDALLEQAATGRRQHRQGNDMPDRAPHNVYRCRGDDAWVSISVGNDAQWQALVGATGQAAWAKDARFLTRQLRWDHRRVLDEEVGRWTATRTREEVTALLQAAGVPSFPSCSSRDLAGDSHLRQRGVIQDARAADGSVRTVVGAPWRFEATPARSGGWTPGLGEHNDYVFGELLGLGRAEIGRLVEEKVIW
jgi:crotonobetainyl-CoA:carnitine CoA-transferase CaiB-like acyl-CoA transferase